MGFSRLFRSRCAALLWAGGILWTAYDVAGDTPPPATPGNAAMQDATGEATTANDLAILANAGGR